MGRKGLLEGTRQTLETAAMDSSQLRMEESRWRDLIGTGVPHEIPSADDDQVSILQAGWLKEEDSGTSEGRKGLLEGTRQTMVTPAMDSSQLGVEESRWRDWVLTGSGMSQMTVGDT